MEFLSGQFDEERKRSKVLESMVVDITKENKVLKAEVDKLKSISIQEEAKKIADVDHWTYY